MNYSLDFHGTNLKFLKLLPDGNFSLGALGNLSHDLLLYKGAELENILLLTIKEPTTIALTVMYLVSFVVGFIGNIMSIKVLTNKRSKRMSGVSATRALLINLAICDLMVVCICMPVTLGHKIYTAWVYGDFLCRAVPFTQAVSVAASVLSLTVISVNRYYSVHNPLNARSFFTWRKIFWTIVIVWVLSSGICMPLIFMNKRDEIRLIEDLPFVFPICREIWPHAKLKQAYNCLLFCALYCLPVTFNLIISFLTGRKLWSTPTHFKKFDSRNQSLPPSRLNNRKNIAKMVVALVLLFAISWLPLYMVDIWIDFNTPDSHREETPPPWILQLRPFAQWLGLTNSSLNPICYCFVGDLYRSAKEMKSRYHGRIVSFFSFSLSENSPASTIPKLLSYKRPAHVMRKDSTCNTSVDVHISRTTIGETTLNSCHPVTLHTFSAKKHSLVQCDQTKL
ncbi:QRFP-like peptide receptor [Acipenser oxyrinchus oxyrinchus]|uniref:QRFP-like peptide receptor n=1 Tax=Acipenser oxyrinchus oxyrinchus TaxID=40147 RepID=A0AAD8G1Z0_ACIOX|nr:QRFP-like peptide receptor [Acipenser oxyrinchus oxyrinchus]